MVIQAKISRKIESPTAAPTDPRRYMVVLQGSGGPNGNTTAEITLWGQDAQLYWNMNVDTEVDVTISEPS